MHFKEESIFYLCSKFHPHRCMLSVIIWLSKFTSDFWSRPDLYFRLLYSPPVPRFTKTKPKYRNETEIPGWTIKILGEMLFVDAF